jgi:hypothetical protein
MDVSTLPILPPVKDRINGQYYNKDGSCRKWVNGRLRDYQQQRSYDRKWRKENYDKYRERENKNRKIWCKKNPENVRMNMKKWKGKIKNRLRVNVGDNGMKRRIGDNNINCEELLGCSWEFLVKYIEEQFEKQTAKYGVNKYTGEAMSWDNYGTGNNCFHIDHIKPFHKYNMNNLDERKMVCVYTNLQPLWSYDNVSKH